MRSTPPRSADAAERDVDSAPAPLSLEARDEAASPDSCPVPGVASPVLDAAMAVHVARGGWDVNSWWSPTGQAPETEPGPLDGYIAELDPENQDATNLAVQDGIQDWRTQLEALPSEERAAFLAATREDVGTLFSNMGALGYDESLALVQDLAAAGELLGPDAIGPLVEELGGHFAAVVEAQTNNGEARGAMRFGAQFQEIIASGEGALLASSLLLEVGGSEHEDAAGWAHDIGNGILGGMTEVRDGQSQAVEDFAALEGQFANWASSNYDLYGPEGIAAAEQAFREEHAEEYARIQEAQLALASTLEGAAVLHGAESPIRNDTINEDLASLTGDVLEGSLDLSNGYVKGQDGQWVRSNLGDSVFADALLRDADGGDTFLDDLHEMATEEGREGLGDELAAVEDQAVFTVSQGLTLEGRFADVGLLVEGLAEHRPEFGPVAAALGGRLRDIEQRAKDGELDWADAQTEVGLAFRESVDGTELPEAVRDRVIAMGIGVQGALGYADHLRPEDSSFADFAQTGIDGFGAVTGVTGDDTVGWTGSRVGAVGNVMGVAGGLLAWAQGNTDLSDSLNTVWSGVQTADMLINGISGSGIVGKMALPVGLLLAGVDLVEAIASRDAEKIAVASLPLVGAGIGASIGLLGGPVGVAAGASLGLVVGGLVQFIGGLFGWGQDDPEEGYEGDTEVMTRAALAEVLPDGTSDETLDILGEQLSETDENFVGVGPVIGLVAAEMNITPTQFLANLAEIAGREGGEDLLDDLVKHNLLDARIANWDAVEDAREDLADGEDVEVPSLEFSQADIESLSELFERGFDSGDFDVDVAVLPSRGNPMGGSYREAPDLHGNYGRNNEDDERVVSVDELRGRRSGP